MSFEKTQALYWFCADYHGGQDSRLYRLLGRLSKRYRPGALERGPDYGLALDIYERLVSKYA